MGDCTSCECFRGSMSDDQYSSIFLDNGYCTQVTDFNDADYADVSVKCNPDCGVFACDSATAKCVPIDSMQMYGNYCVELKCYDEHRGIPKRSLSTLKENGLCAKYEGQRGDDHCNPVYGEAACYDGHLGVRYGWSPLFCKSMQPFSDQPRCSSYKL
eukprot:111591_1